MIEFILFLVGLVILVKGADLLVDGASSLAARFGISAIAIGLTVVAFGTSTPELVVSLTSALRGNTDIALGNITGSSEVEIKKRSMIQIMIFIVGGLAALTIGSKIAVDNVISLARLLNISDTLIGFTLVAAGTSLPELFTNIAAVRKKNPDIAIGNIVGSNIFNIFLILGATSVVREVPIKGFQMVDIAVLLFATLLLFASIFIWKRHSIGRKEGIVMVALYVAYVVFLINRG